MELSINAHELPAPPMSIIPRTTFQGPPSPAAPPSPSRHAFPVDWLCSTCGATHSVLEILPTDVAATPAVQCACENPTLQAVYDQHGCIFLYWRRDPQILDLRDPSRVSEAAWRVSEAVGGVAWLRDVLLFQARARPVLSSRLSTSSFGSDDTVIRD